MSATNRSDVRHPLDAYQTPAWADQRYNIIYADPPWSYRDKASAGERGVTYHYPTMDLDTLKGLPMRSIAADDCTLFLWATFPTLADVFPLLDAWGFKYKTVAFTWVKVSKNNKLKMGMGNWTRANAEICLLATRGHPKRVSASVQSAILAEPREHSQKPDEARERIVQLMGDLPRIELFARTHTPGWDVWGLETGKFDEGA